MASRSRRQRLHRFLFSAEAGGQYSVTYDLFGFLAYRYSKVDRCYTPTDTRVLNELSLCRCENLRDVLGLSFPGNKNVSDYYDCGYQNMGYALAVSRFPVLADYLDNPGLLTLLINQPEGFLSNPPVHCSRLELLRQLTRNPCFAPFHLTWLGKVFPGVYPPARLVKVIHASLLRPEFTLTDVKPTRRNRQLRKSFSHQSRWTLEGLRAAARLVHDGSVDSHSAEQILRAANNQDPYYLSQLRTARRRLKHLSKRWDLPSVVQSRIDRLIDSKDYLDPKIVKYIDQAWKGHAPGEYANHILAPILKDSDIPPPRLKGNQGVQHLCTLKALKAHAQKAGNCVWSSRILLEVVSGKLDVFRYSGDHLCTIAVDRDTLEISQVEARERRPMTQNDYQAITTWASETERSLAN